MLVVPALKPDWERYHPHIKLANNLESRAKRVGVSVALLRDLYPHYSYADLARHPAAVIIPYQGS